MKNARKISPELKTEKAITTPNHSTTTVADLAKQGSGLRREGTMHEPRTPAQRRVISILEAKWFSGLMSVITVYCLFGDDFRSAFASKEQDMGIYAIAFICFILFTLEFLGSCHAKAMYVGSFYFYLDLTATASLIPDIGFIWELMVSTTTSNVAAISAGKTGRIVRVIRIVRLIRIVKLIKWRHNEEQKQVESKTGGRMAEMTTRRVVMIVIFLCFILPVFDGGYNDPINSFETKGFETLHVFNFQPHPSQMFAAMLNVIQL